MEPDKIGGRKVDIFQIKNSAQADLKQIYSTKIESDLGIKLGDEDLTNVNAHLTREAANNPDKLKTMAEKVREFKNLPGEINRQIRYIYGEGARLKELEALLKKVNNPTGYLIKELTQENKKKLKEKFNIEPQNAESELTRVQNELKKIDEAKLGRSQGEGARLNELETLLKEVIRPKMPNLTSRDDTGFLVKAMWNLDLLNIKDFKWTELSPIEKKRNETKLDKTIRYGKYAGKALVRTFDALNWLTRKTVTTTKEVMKATPIVQDYFQSDEAQKNERILKEKFKIEPWNTEAELVKVRDELKRIEAAKLERGQMEQRLEELKAEIFNENFAPTLIVGEITRKKINEQFKEILSEGKNPAKPVDKLFELKKGISRVASVESTSGIDYNKEGALEDISRELDAALGFRARIEFRNALRNVTSLTQLEEKLLPFIEGDAGSRQSMLANLRELLVRAQISEPKQEIIRRFLTKIETDELEKQLKEESELESTRANIIKQFGSFK